MKTVSTPCGAAIMPMRFTKLYRYMDADFVKEHPYIHLSVDGEDMIFQITALFVTDIGFDYIAPNPTGDDLTGFFETVARKNWLDFDGVTFSEEDTVLTLSTCCRRAQPHRSLACLLWRIPNCPKRNQNTTIIGHPSLRY